MKTFKFIYALFALSFIMLFTSKTAVTASAAVEQPTVTEEKTVFVDDGYTPEGIYYEVYDTITTKSASTDVSINSVISMEVSRQVTYSGHVPNSTIPKSIFWTEQLDDYTTLTGTLYWNSTSYVPSQNITIANYGGTLTGRT